MRQNLSREWQILGGNAEEALQAIRHIDDPMLLEALIKHEGGHYKRKTVLRALEARLRKVIKRQAAYS